LDNFEVRDVQSRLRISRSKVYTLLRDGKLDHFRIGRKILIPVSAIEKIEREGIR
jgi:excisionase family DNA binding protein